MSINDFDKNRVTMSGVLAVLLASAGWGASGIWVKLMMAAGPVSALCLAFWRDASSFAVFFALVCVIDRRQMQVRRDDWHLLLGMGLSLGIFHVVLNLGYQINGASITTVQQSAMPAIVLLVARILWKEPLTAVKLLSLAGVIIGTVMVSGIIGSGGQKVTAMGIVVGFIVPIFYAGWNLFGKALRRGYSAIAILTWAFGIATLILMPIQFFFGGGLLPESIPTISYLWFAGLIGVSTVGGFFLFTFALGRLPAGIAALLVMSEIAFALTYARFILGEILTPLEIAGSLLVVTGVILLLAPSRQPAPVRPMLRR